jgi:hypothetical protein
MEQKTEKEGLYRDLTTGALLNKNNAALLAYKIKREKEKEFESFKEKIKRIDDDISEIKNVLKAIAEKI